jgi:purine-binding chemotaxis protein CheW
MDGLLRQGEAAAREAPAPQPERQVVFHVGAERYALPLSAVREVVPPHPPFARVPRAGGAVRGVMNLRGRVVAVVDLAELVGLPPQPLAAGSGQVLILDREKRALGLLIGPVLGVESLLQVEAGGDGLVAGLATGRAGAVTLLAVEPLAAAAAALFGGGAP